MTREELHTFAAAGVAQKLAGIERELATYHKEWPELFISVTAPQLLRPALKNGNSNGHVPTPTARPRLGHATTRAAIEARIETLRTLLASGPQRIVDLQAALDAKGLGLSSTALQKVLRGGCHATVKRTDGRFYWSVTNPQTARIRITKGLTKAFGTRVAAKLAKAAAPPRGKRPPMSAATRKKLARAMKRRHASGEIARAKAAKAAARASS